MVGYRVGAGMLAVIDSEHTCPAYTADNQYKEVPVVGCGCDSYLRLPNMRQKAGRAVTGPLLSVTGTSNAGHVITGVRGRSQCKPRLAAPSRC